MWYGATILSSTINILTTLLFNKECIIINKDIRRKSFSFDMFLSLKWCYFALLDYQL